MDVYGFTHAGRIPLCAKIEQFFNEQPNDDYACTTYKPVKNDSLPGPSLTSEGAWTHP